MTLLQMTNLDLNNKRVLIREDLNVPIENGKIVSDKRIQAALPTIQAALEAGAQVMIMSHLGRPKEGEVDPQYSLAPVAEYLSEKLGQEVPLVTDWVSGFEVKSGKAILCENVRFNKGEKANDEVLSKQMAAICDIFVMDAFASAHRAQASTHGVACFAPVACAGPLLVAELAALDKVSTQPKKPLVAVVGGAKISTKINILESLIDKVDQLIVGGGIANTFLAAAGYSIGKSLHEKDAIEVANKLMDIATSRGAAIPLPTDVIVASEFSAKAQPTLKAIDDVADNDLILDVGPETIQEYNEYIAKANTILWNGPLGVFEFEAFAKGTEALAQAIADSKAYSVAGGGDTIAAIEKFSVTDKISYISTGGGAFLAYIEGKPLPAIEVLEQRANEV